ncbi:MAG: hypothetical protein LPK80_04245 [Bacteroidota bacterium]|nr:hypothetical protein [Bacteroidota bacterium]
MDERSKPNCNQEILNVLAEKSSTKQLIYRNTLSVFEQLKATLQEIARELNDNICDIDNHVVVEFKDRGQFEAEIVFSGDTLIFHMHTNVFAFDKGHMVNKMGYVKEDPLRGYFGIINVYNFLSDSLKYNRVEDLGFLLGRIFINKDRHYFVEGRRQLGFLFNDLPHQTVENMALRKIIESAILQALDFDLTAPDFRDMSVVTVQQIRSISSDLRIATSKKLGFRMSYENAPKAARNKKEED